MRSLKFIVCCLSILSVTACVNNITPSGAPSSTTSSPPSASTTATTSAPAAASAGGPTAAPPAAGAGDSQGANTISNTPVSVRVTELRRTSGDMVTLRVVVTNTGTEDIPGPPARGALANSYLVDPAGQKKYEVIRDAKGQPLASEVELTPISVGAKREFFAQFPAPPPATMRMSVYFGGKSPIMDVPLSQ